MPNDALELVKAKLRKQHYLHSDNIIETHYKKVLSKEELAAWASLRKNKDIYIQKFDKGNMAAIFDKDTYNKSLAPILNTLTKNECKDSFQLAEEIYRKDPILLRVD